MLAACCDVTTMLTMCLTFPALTDGMLSLTCKVLDNTLCVALDVLAHFGRCCLSGFGYNFMIATSQLCGPVSGVTFMFDYL